MQFFTSPNDLLSWVKQQESPDLAANKIIEVIGGSQEQDIVDACRSIYEDKRTEKQASEVLYRVLAKHDLTQIREGKMKEKLIKEAQAVMRTDSLYGNMDMRICPKLPKQSAGQGLISTYNCRTYCLDSIVFDDDPNRVYCAEALWRRHVMDKFSREFKNKEGKWVGGYINERFQSFHDDGGNQMELAHGERTRKPRPHQYSTERRLEEGRGVKTTDITMSAQKVTKIASVAKNENDSKIYQIFDDIVEMKQSGLNDEDIIFKTAEHYGMSILDVAGIHKMALDQLNRNIGVVYAYDGSKMKKTAQENIEGQPTFVVKNDIKVRTQSGETILEANTTVVEMANNRFQIVSGVNAGQEFALVNEADKTSLGSIDDAEGMIQSAAEETMLNEPQVPVTASDDFSIVES